ncbi:MAG: PEP-utilizing enzyme, partial [Nocardiaceae bacterium]|nr:PEP-utilizing enzyme [Nocardiaceae bacterium]
VVSTSGPELRRFTSKDRIRLARMAKRTRQVFGAAQDMEWLVDADGELRLLQSRPVTAASVLPRGSRPLGAGPISEVFPDPLSALELDLWKPPLQDGIQAALKLSGAVGPDIARSDVVFDIEGRLAVDLEVVGAIRPRPSWWERLDPRPGLRRLRAAWRIGRLRAGFAGIAENLTEEIDAMLADVPPMSDLDDHELAIMLENARRALVGLHAHEILAGFFLDPDATAPTAGEMATAAVARARLDGLADARIIEKYPIALVLLPPQITAGRELPGTPASIRSLSRRAVWDPSPAVRSVVAREALRIRVRWVHELMSRTALELGARLHARGQLRDASDVRHLTRRRLFEMVGDFDAVTVVQASTKDTPPLPEVFRLAKDGSIVADTRHTKGSQGVSPGRVRGEVTHDVDDASGKVLVTENLSPALAAALPSLAAVVAQTGSPLSHLAILAREYRVPVVVGFASAKDELPVGTQVVVDGALGTVDVVDSRSNNGGEP